MKNSTIVFLAILGVILLSLGSLILGVWSDWKQAVFLENKIEAQYTTNKSSYDNMWKKFIEVTKVSELQAKQYKDVYLGLIEGRYKDQNLLFKMVQEDNPKMDSAVYVQIQRVIESGRNAFDNNQKAMTDVIREYNNVVGVKILMPMVTGKKKLNPNDYIITSARTSNAFDSKQDDVIDITGGK
jgi:hypothetical protein